MKIALEKLDEIREEYDSTHADKYKDSHIQKIILFTDGKDTVSKEWDLERFLKEFELRRAEDKMGDNIFIKYVRLPGAFLTEEQKEEFGVPVVNEKFSTILRLAQGQSRIETGSWFVR